MTPGQSVGSDASQVLFTVADLDRLQVVADVYERDLALVKVSQVGACQCGSLSGKRFCRPSWPLSVMWSIPIPGRSRCGHGWTIRINSLKPEMFARLKLDIGDASPFLTIPKEAVVEIDGKHFVYRGRCAQSLCEARSNGVQCLQ